MKTRDVLESIYQEIKTGLGPTLSPAVKDVRFGFANISNAMGPVALFIPAGGNVEQVAHFVERKELQAYLLVRIVQKSDMVRTLLTIVDDTLNYFLARPVVGHGQVMITKFDIDTNDDQTVGEAYFDLEIMHS